MRLNKANKSEIAVAAANLLRTINHMVIATADKTGQPWAVPVSQLTLPDGRLNWISATTTRHSQNIAANSRTSAVLWTATVEEGEISLFLEGQSHAVEDGTAVQAIIDQRFSGSNKTKVDDFISVSGYRMYVFIPTMVWMNDDSHTKFVVDWPLVLAELANEKTAS